MDVKKASSRITLIIKLVSSKMSKTMPWDIDNMMTINMNNRMNMRYFTTNEVVSNDMSSWMYYWTNTTIGH